MNKNDQNHKDIPEELLPIAARAVVQVSPTYREATVTVYPPKNGGRDITANDIFLQLKEMNVDYGVLKMQVGKIVENRMYSTQQVIAKWTPPENGTDGKIRFLFPQTVELKPAKDEKGNVDYKNLGIVREIRKGTPIAEITPPTTGTPGMDLRSRRIPQIPGRRIDYSLGKNTCYSEDGLQILANADGHLYYAKNSFHIDTEFVVDGDVNAATGNIHFFGDVIVKGDVTEGFTVVAGKDIRVSGAAVSAALAAGGDIHVNKGCKNCNLSANGDIQAGFLEHSKLVCKRNLTAQSLIHCEVFCEGSMEVRGPQGLVAGGNYTVMKSAEVGTAGSRSYTKTNITIGSTAHLNNEMEQAKKTCEQLDADISKCQQILDFLDYKRHQLGTLPEDKELIYENMISTKQQRTDEKETLLARIAEIQNLLSEKQYLELRCRREVFPGVVVRISDYVYTVETSMKSVKFILGESGIEVRANY